MKVRGIGVSTMMYGVGYGFSRPDFASAEIEIGSDGTVTLWTGASELGQGIYTALSQIAAQELGLLYQDVHVIGADTVSTSDSGPVSASRSVYVQGLAVIKACQDLKSQLSYVAADLLGEPGAQVDFARGEFYVREDPSRVIGIVKAAEECQKKGQRFHGFGWVNNFTSDVNPDTSQGDAYSAYAWASQLAEVEVDLDTGQVQVLRLASAADAGKAINPMLVEGQVQGGAVQGLGFALMENMVVEGGEFKNARLSTYLIPTATDVPPIDTLLVEVPDPTGPYGAKGIGEPATIPTAPAILNAIAQAIGVRIRNTPATPERIVTVLGYLPNKDPVIRFEDIPYPPL